MNYADSKTPVRLVNFPVIHFISELLATKFYKMKKTSFIFSGCLLLLFSFNLLSQKLWTEEDRAYLLVHLTQTRDSLIKETTNWSEAPWNFKESADRWSIKEVTEHIAIWELLLMHELSKAFECRPSTTMDAQARQCLFGFHTGRDATHFGRIY